MTRIFPTAAFDAAVANMSELRKLGHLQYDAASVYDVRGRRVLRLLPEADEQKPLRLVGCWPHCRYLFEAALAAARRAWIP